MTLTRIPMPSPCYSARDPAGVRLIVLHTAEGARTIESLGNFFASPANGVSSHAGADDTPGTIGVYVKRADKAWTQASFNPAAVALELCGWAAWDTAEWFRHPNMLDNCARWVAEEAEAFGIPIVELSPAAAQSGGRGVCQHVDLGAGGGGHVDCGPGFPFDTVLDMAAGAVTPPKEDDMPAFPPCTFDDAAGNQNVFYVDGDGRLCHRYAGRDGRWSPLERLSDGWARSAGLAHHRSAGVDQVWGEDSAGGPRQCYWSGHQWVTQGMP